MAVERFYRQGALATVLGFESPAQLRDAIRRGVVPPPDGRLAGRMAIWRESTVKRLQSEALARGGAKGMFAKAREAAEGAAQPP